MENKGAREGPPKIMQYPNKQVPVHGLWVEEEPWRAPITIDGRVFYRMSEHMIVAMMPSKLKITGRPMTRIPKDILSGTFRSSAGVERGASVSLACRGPAIDSGDFTGRMSPFGSWAPMLAVLDKLSQIKKPNKSHTNNNTPTSECRQQQQSRDIDIWRHPAVNAFCCCAIPRGLPLARSHCRGAWQKKFL